MYERERDLNMLLSCFREKMPGFRCPLRDERWRERGREGNTAGVARAFSVGGCSRLLHLLTPPGDDKQYAITII